MTPRLYMVRFMFRMWIKEVKDNHFIQDTVVCDDSNDTRTHKILHALETACHEFDLAVPIWLSNNLQDFKRHSKTRFTTDSFVEEIDFDYLEIQVLEEDDQF